ncbi:Scr1 family TA system antitoxin-like transcriptional regulator [Kitasatospora sp. NPDC093806]|uniref:Scr1 family TA system antitoxin-like transcriptional regulator n=1 Tax=Kitasatospora sp. NPDC093806 TaxID=3155075 RepID=UPI00341C50D1
MTRSRPINRNLRSSPAAVFGGVLQHYREARGISQGELAMAIPCSRPHISRIESGDRNPQENFVIRAEALLGTGTALMDLWKEIDWYARVEHPDWFRRYAIYEEKACRICEFQPIRVSGLLQTEAYARALFGSGTAAGDPELIEERVESRLARQRRLYEDDGPLLVVVHSEAAIRSMVGGPEVMYEQLGHLLLMGRHPNVIHQVAPFSLGERLPFGTLVTFVTAPDGKSRLYSESLDQGHFIEEPREVQRRLLAYDRLLADALSPSESAALVSSVREGLLNMTRTGPSTSKAMWRKSSYSDNNGGNCIEVAGGRPTRLVRDSKDPEGPVLSFRAPAWQSFVDAVRADEFRAPGC